jgi:hypothetical protein
MRLCVAMLLLLVLGACTETRRTNGEDCLKDDDCLSGVCSSQKCTAAPPLLDATVMPPVIPDADVGDGPSDAPADAPELMDAGADANEAG